MNLALSRHVNNDEDCFPLEVHCMDSGSKSIVVYTTLFGSVVGWDLRAPGNAFRLENGAKNGIITTFCIDPNHNWLTLGTTNGTLDTWDLRFQLPINNIQHSSGKEFYFMDRIKFSYILKNNFYISLYWVRNWFNCKMIDIFYHKACKILSLLFGNYHIVRFDKSCFSNTNKSLESEKQCFHGKSEDFIENDLDVLQSIFEFQIVS